MTSPKNRKNPWLPRALAALFVFLLKFKGKLADYRLLPQWTIGIGYTEIDSIIGLITTAKDDQDDYEEMKADLDRQDKKRKKSRIEAVKAVTNGVNRIKVHSTYTEEIGADFEIIGSDVSIDPDTSKPTPRYKKTGEGYKFTVNLHSYYFDGFIVSRKRPGGELTKLATVHQSTYIDGDTMVDGTIYQFQYVINEEAVGLVSDLMVIHL